MLFDEDRSFIKSDLEAPVEGTQITLFLVGDIQRYQELVREIPLILKRWCVHSEVEITFEDDAGGRRFFGIFGD